jgi:hypothetical protein
MKKLILIALLLPPFCWGMEQQKAALTEKQKEWNKKFAREEAVYNTNKCMCRRKEKFCTLCTKPKPIREEEYVELYIV